MQTKSKVSLIPRYNWDFGLLELQQCLFAIPKIKHNNAKVFNEIFLKDPLFTNAGRTSLYTILKSLSLPTGSEIGVPLYCCPVVFYGIRKAGLIPRFIDIDIENYCLSSSDLKKKLHTLKALVVVHMFGNPANMDSILSICDHIPVVEDCAQSLFSKYKDKYTGTLSGYSFFSFRSGKYLSSGEGSSIFIDNPEILYSAKNIIDRYHRKSLFSEFAAAWANYIKSKFYKRPLYGAVGYPLGKRIEKKINLTAKTGFKPEKIGKSNLALIELKLAEFIDKIKIQRSNSKFLIKNIKNEKLTLPKEAPQNWNNYSQFAIRLNSESKRDEMAKYLLKHGIDSAKYGDEIMTIVKNEYSYQGDCPLSETVSKTTLVIPNHYTLNHQDIKFITDCVNEGERLL